MNEGRAQRDELVYFICLKPSDEVPLYIQLFKFVGFLFKRLHSIFAERRASYMIEFFDFQGRYGFADSDEFDIFFERRGLFRVFYAL
jgi:hypothetical protein